MSIYTVTIYPLMQLDKAALAYALRTFDKEFAGMLDLLGETPAARQDEVVLADLEHVLTLAVSSASGPRQTAPNT